jgi:hypothetical protein
MKKDLSETDWKGKEQYPLPQDSDHFGGIFCSSDEDSRSIEGRNFSPANFSRTNLPHDVTHNVFVLLSHLSFQQLLHTEPSVVGC